jgi:hypothetical protein
MSEPQALEAWQEPHWLSRYGNHPPISVDTLKPHVTGATLNAAMRGVVRPRVTASRPVTLAHTAAVAPRRNRGWMASLAIT